MDIRQIREWLEKAYSEFYCEAGGQCKFLAECQKGLPNQLIGNHKAQVGDDYATTYPKILVVGMEPVCSKDDSKECRVEHIVEHVCSLKDACNPHWIRTFYTIVRILGEAEQQPAQYAYDKVTMQNQKYESFGQKFAFTNYFKCVFSEKIQRSQKPHSSAMRQNCANLLLREIEILEPDLVILQGKFGKCFWNKIKWENVEERRTRVKGRTFTQGLYKCYLNDTRPFLCLAAYHPTSRGIWTCKEVHDDFLYLLQKARRHLEEEKRTDCQLFKQKN